MKSLLNLLIVFLIFNFQLSTFKSFAQTQLWGMTKQGGKYNAGVIFKTDGSGNNQTVQYNFDGATNGKYPFGSLIQASDGMLYGMTELGGVNNYGVLFQFDPATYTYTKKLDFDSIIGIKPSGSLMQASDGMLYGMTEAGGAIGAGVMFQYDPATSTYTKKLDFHLTNGRFPLGSLIQASDGMFYGMTSQGGVNTYGVLFQYDPATSTYTKKFDFDGAANGGNPWGSLMQASDGMLYGVTGQTAGVGTNHSGVLFQYDPVTSTYTKKFDFNIASGYDPKGSLIQASDGMLYGMNFQGGANGMGVIFQYDPATSTYTKKFDFDGAINGKYPFGSLMQASNGMFYGMTSGGGANNKGVIFQFDPATSSYTKKLDFAVANGAIPYLTNLIETPVTISTATLSTTTCLSGSINVSYTIAGAYDTSNVFTAQLSDAAGSFASPINIGSIASTNVGSINAVVPTLNTAGGSYKIRVVSSSPVITGSNVSYNQLPTVNLGNDTALCQGQTVILNGGSANQYLWSNGSTTSSINVSTVGTYWVQANNGQCSNRDSINITFNSCEIKIETPNIFTPNNDGNNDTWQIVNNVTEMHVFIYDRWGTMIYEQKGKHINWDGRTTAGLMCTDGVYYYVLKDSNDYKKGYIQLVR